MFLPHIRSWPARTPCHPTTATAAPQCRTPSSCPTEAALVLPADKLSSVHRTTPANLPPWRSSYQRVRLSLPVTHADPLPRSLILRTHQTFSVHVDQYPQTPVPPVLQTPHAEKPSFQGPIGLPETGYGLLVPIPRSHKSAQVPRGTRNSSDRGSKPCQTTARKTPPAYPVCAGTPAPPLPQRRSCIHFLRIAAAASPSATRQCTLRVRSCS